MYAVSFSLRKNSSPQLLVNDFLIKELQVIVSCNRETTGKLLHYYKGVAGGGWDCVTVQGEDGTV